jgi:hypothetical protein
MANDGAGTIEFEKCRVPGDFDTTGGSRWRIKILPTQEHFSLREIPPTEVGGVSKFNLRSVVE